MRRCEDLAGPPISITLACSSDMRVQVDLLQSGACEELKAGVHATALVLAAVMGAYNAAAWFSRREPHLAVNAVFYAALTLWERNHLSHHLARHHAQREGEFLAIVEEAPGSPRAAA